ncbi:hypothetical protein I7I48_02756 [Histoplasma ohiense]|nr:hypothetical protein I7I48_02756 [Histoplasma ohiense (nom. inval.)]
MVNPYCVPGCDGTCMQAKSIHPNPRASLAPWTTSWQGCGSCHCSTSIFVSRVKPAFGGESC